VRDTIELVARPVRASLDELMPPGASREPMPTDGGKSGARLERVVAGARFVLKLIDRADDWTLRSTGSLEPPPVVLWRAGVLDALPACFVQPIVDVASDAGRAWLLMDDIGDTLLPGDGGPIAPEANAAFLDHLAQLCAIWWERPDIPVVVDPVARYLELSPWTALTEAALGSGHLVPRLIAQGWDLLAEIAPDAAEVVVPLAWDPSPLVAALDTTPQTFVHGNWKLDNLGITPDGRTVLFDWETPGRGTACAELAWYLAINCDRLPVSKEATIELFRAALERRGIDTEPWWERQLTLALLGGLVQFGWEKALGGPGPELDWWAAHALAGEPELRR
jgi:hypothetical protein